MSDVGFLVRYALRSLVRGGQRTLLAMVCIAFGVLSLVALQLLAAEVGRSTNVEPRRSLGGDLRISLEDGPLTAGHRAVIDSLMTAGALERVTYFARGELAMLRSTRSGLVQFVARSMAVEPESYPLTGALELVGRASLEDAVRDIGHVVITRDLAQRLDVGPGDTLRYGGGLQRPATLIVGGVAQTMPDRRGQTMLYGFDTAGLLSDSVEPAWASAVSRDEGAAAQSLAEAGFAVTRASQQGPDRTARLFGTMLRGAGLLGLIIGGIGIAYTLQVMLTRRRTEIATLRTLGYRTSRLLLLFGLEAATLGLVGGIVGALLALALSAQLVHLLDRTAGALMLEPSVTWHAVAVGPLIGTATAVLFGMAAIMRAASVRPAVLLRELPVRATARAAATAGALYLILALSFTAVAAGVMGSIAGGIGVVTLAAAGTVLLGAVLVGLLWLVVRVPLPHLPLVNMARANLRSSQVRSAFSLIALFVGTFAIGFAAAAMVSGSERVAERRGSDEGLNLRVFVGSADEADVHAALHDAGAREIVETTALEVADISVRGRALPVMSQVDVVSADALSRLVAVSVERDVPGAPNAALVPAFVMRTSGVSVGDTLVVVGANGAVTLRVAGSYAPRDNDLLAAPRGIIVGDAAAARIGGRAQRSVMTELEVADLASASVVLGRRLSSSMIISRRDMNDFLVSQYRSLFTFVVAVAALALLAGAVLIANAVTLALVERRRELGVLMAIGYTSRRVLRTILLENGTLGLVAGVAGVIAVHVVSAILNARNPGIDLRSGAASAVLLVTTSTGLAMAAAALVAWKPVHVRPLEVLRDE